MTLIGGALTAQDDAEPEDTEAPSSQQKEQEAAEEHRDYDLFPDEMFPDEAPDVSDAEIRQTGADPCALNEEGNWIDWLNRTVTTSVCGSSRWFDSFFGTQREFEDRDSTFGRLGVGACWDEDDGIDPEFRFRAKWNFPNLENRVQVTLGRGTADEVLDGQDTTSPAEQFFDEESEWLVGFGYHVSLGNRSRFSPSVGASWSSGLDPYVRMRYVYQRPVGEKRQFRLRFVPQWQESKGFGYTFNLTLERTISQKFLLRSDLSVKDFEEKFVGYSYGAYLTLFQKLNPKNALKYRIGVVSQSQLPYQPQDAGGAIAWRTTVYKEIFIIESLVGTTWRRRPEESSRDPELILGLVFELKFGQ